MSGRMGQLVAGKGFAHLTGWAPLDCTGAPPILKTSFKPCCEDDHLRIQEQKWVSI